MMHQNKTKKILTCKESLYIFVMTGKYFIG